MWCLAPPLLAISMVLSSADTTAPAPAPVATHEGEARIWYFHNSGWAVETARHLLVFDFIEAAGYDTVPRLATRLVETAVKDHRRVVVLVSHEHEDHYSPAIFRWQKLDPRILYVFGWKVRPSENRVLLEARADTVVDSLRIRTVRSTDSGVGYLVSADGLTIFHAGDHAEWDASARAAYRGEIDWLAALQQGVDIAFLPIATGETCEALDDIRMGATYALVKLRPAVAFPMHVRCTEKLGLYRAFAEGARAYAGRGTLLYAENPGDGFRYDPRSRRATRLDRHAE